MVDLTDQIEKLEIGQTSDCVRPRSLHNDTPISSLPHEIMTAVFFIGWQMQVPRGHSTKGPLPFEIAISHVSRHWRCVALGTPTLWTNIIRFQFQKDIDSINAYLSRSSLVAFDLTIAIGESHDELEFAFEDWGEEAEAWTGPEEDRESIDSFYQLIKPHLERCKSLNIYLQQYTEGNILLRRLSTARASSLRSLTVSYIPMLEVGPRFAAPLEIFQGGAPILNHLELNNLLFTSCHPPTSNLTSLSVGSLSDIFAGPRPGANFITALSSILLLSRLEIEENAYEWPSDMPIELSSLRQLIYTFSTTSSFLLALDAPLLEEVTFIFPPTEIVLDVALAEHCPAKLPLVRTLGLKCGKKRIGPTNARLSSRAFPLITKLSYSPPQRFILKGLTDFFAYLKEVDYLHGWMWPHLTTFNIPPSTYLNTHLMEELKTTSIFRASAGYPDIRITQDLI